MKLNEAVRALRHRVGKSQQIFATELGISIRGLSNYEKDHRVPVKLLIRLLVMALDKGHEDIAHALRRGFLEQAAGSQRALAFILGQEKQKWQNSRPIRETA